MACIKALSRWKEDKRDEWNTLIILGIWVTRATCCDLPSSTVTLCISPPIRNGQNLTRDHERHAAHKAHGINQEALLSYKSSHHHRSPRFILSLPLIPSRFDITRPLGWLQPRKAPRRIITVRGVRRSCVWNLSKILTSAIKRVDCSSNDHYRYSDYLLCSRPGQRTGAPSSQP